MATSKTARGTARVDQFGNFFKTTLTTSAADTLTFFEWATGFSIKDGYGFIIHKIEWVVQSAAVTLLNAADDRILAGLVTNNTWTSGGILEAGINDYVIDNFALSLNHARTAEGQLVELKFVHDFTNEPGGGRLVAPKPLYFAVTSVGAGAALTIYSKTVYTMIKLSEQFYRELYESMNPSA